MANRGNTGRKFRLALPRSDYCDHSAEMIAATPVKRAEGPKLYGFFPSPVIFDSFWNLLYSGHHTEKNSCM